MTDTDANEGQADSPFTELGLSGLFRAGGFVQEEFLPALRGKRAIKTFREMQDNDPLVGAILFAIDKLLRGVKWNVDPGKDNTEDEERTVLLKECMDDMTITWEDFISDVLSMLTYGWSLFEIVYKKRQGDKPDGSKSKYNDGKIGWRKFGIRSQDSLLQWVFDDEDGSLVAMIQIPPPHYAPITIPIEKSLLFRTSVHKNNPEGRSILRNAYRPWYFKKRIEEIEAIGVERDLAGFPVLYMDPALMSPSASDDQKRSFLDYQLMIRNIRRDEQEGVILPTQYDREGRRMIELQLLSTGGTRQFDTNGIIDRYNRNIAMTVLADFILLGHEQTGSFALSSDKTDLFAVALGAWLDSIAAVLNTYAVPRLMKLNGYSLENLPQIKPSDIEEQPLLEIIQSLATLAGMGMPIFPNEELQERLFERMNLPMSDEAKAGTTTPTPAPTPLSENELNNGPANDNTAG